MVESLSKNNFASCLSSLGESSLRFKTAIENSYKNTDVGDASRGEMNPASSLATNAISFSRDSASGAAILLCDVTKAKTGSKVFFKCSEY